MPGPILHVLHGVTRGGAETMAMALAEAQRSAGHDVAFLLLGDGGFAGDLEREGIPATMAPVRSKFDLSGCRRAVAAIRRVRPGLVHVHGSRPVLLLAFGRWRTPATPVVFTRHGSVEWYWPNRLTRFVHARIEGALLSRVTAIACVNEALWERDRRTFSRLPVELVVNGIDTAEFRPATPDERAGIRSALQWPAEAPVAVCTSRLIRMKGVHVLLDAWQDVARATPGSLLVLVGEGEMERELKDRAARSGVGDSIRWMGSVGVTSPFVRAADLLVFPSIEGCFGRSAMEALAAGTPVVASRLPGTDRFVTDGEHAVLVPAGDATALAGALVTLLADEPTRRALGRRGRALAEARYSIRGMALAYEAVYARAGRHGSPSD